MKSYQVWEKNVETWKIEPRRQMQPKGVTRMENKENLRGGERAFTKKKKNSEVEEKHELLFTSEGRTKWPNGCEHNDR